MREELLRILNYLRIRDASEFYYTLTINFENILPNFRDEKLDIGKVVGIVDDYDADIKSYNLTIKNYKYDELRYRGYYYDATIIFFSGGIISEFTSTYVSGKEMSFSSLDKLFMAYELNKSYSNKLYDVIQ